MSSSRIRELLSEGRVNLARRMLGRPYGVEGRVVRGAERGRTLGFPTANLLAQNRVIPRRGVYVTATLIEGAWRRSVTNVGTRPTFERDAEPSVERDDGRHGAGGARALRHRLHDQLVAEVQAVEDAEGEHRRPRDLGVVRAVEKSHKQSDE